MGPSQRFVSLYCHPLLSCQSHPQPQVSHWRNLLLTLHQPSSKASHKALLKSMKSIGPPLCQLTLVCRLKSFLFHLHLHKAPSTLFNTLHPHHVMSLQQSVHNKPTRTYLNLHRPTLSLHQLSAPTSRDQSPQHLH